MTDFGGIPTPSARPADNPDDFWDSPEEAEARRLEQWAQREERRAAAQVEAENKAKMRRLFDRLSSGERDAVDPLRAAWHGLENGETHADRYARLMAECAYEIQPGEEDDPDAQRVYEETHQSDPAGANLRGDVALRRMTEFRPEFR